MSWVYVLQSSVWMCELVCTGYWCASTSMWVFVSLCVCLSISVCTDMFEQLSTCVCSVLGFCALSAGLRLPDCSLMGPEPSLLSSQQCTTSALEPSGKLTAFSKQGRLGASSRVTKASTDLAENLKGGTVLPGWLIMSQINPVPCVPPSSRRTGCKSSVSMKEEPLSGRTSWRRPFPGCLSRNQYGA